MSADDTENTKLPPAWEALLKKIYEGKVSTGDIDVPTALQMAESYTEAIIKGFDKTLDDIAYNSPDYLMLQGMERDAYRFSAAKSYQVNKELTQLLKNGEDIRTFTEWRREALKIVDLWNNTWQKAEYNTALSTARNNADYIRFKENEDTMPLLKRSGVHDGRECPICVHYDGLIAPIDSPVWNYAYGDLHFNDRCRMLQLPNGTPTPADKIPSDDAIPKAFRVNLAEKMLAFPPGHPYYEGVPRSQLKSFVNQFAPKRDA